MNAIRWIMHLASRCHTSGISSGSLCSRMCLLAHSAKWTKRCCRKARDLYALGTPHQNFNVFFLNLGTFGSFSSASAPIFATICKKQNLHMIFATWCKWFCDIFQHFLRSSSTKLSCRFLKILEKLLTFKLAYLCQNLLFFWNCFKIANLFDWFVAERREYCKHWKLLQNTLCFLLDSGVRIDHVIRSVSEPTNRENRKLKKTNRHEKL